MKVLVASHNDGKVVEMRRLLALHGVELVGLDAVRRYEPAPETGASFAENAMAKAREAVAHTGLPAVADDSGLAVDALNGMPGVLSARWSGSAGPPLERDRANLELVLAQLADVPAERRTARFVCAAAFALPDGRADVFEGVAEGTVLREPRGSGGFGYDPLFVPAGSTLTTAELSPADKDALSHRGKALHALAPALLVALAGGSTTRAHDGARGGTRTPTP